MTFLFSNPLSLNFQAEQESQYGLPQAHRPPKPPKESYLREFIFSPHPFTPSNKAHVKGSPLYTDLSDGKRGQPSWTIKEYKRNSEEKGKQLTALDLQVLDSHQNHRRAVEERTKHSCPASFL